MIDFTTLKSLKIPEGVVVKITDISGNKLWEFNNETEDNSTVVLQVQKITSDTYINETTYTDESFILLNIYPKTNGTVSVTYEGLTKTITDTSGEAEPEAQKVFFGTFNGVSDSVITPTNGTLTIDGDYRGFGCGTYNITKINATSCPCVEDIVNWGIVNFIPGSAFKGCEKLTSIVIPEAVVEIESYAFSNCVNLTSIILPEGIRTINNHTFYNCTSLSSIIIPSSVSGIGNYAFYNCTNLSSITIPDELVLINNYAFWNCINLTDLPKCKGVRTIRSKVFYNCTGLTSITIPKNIIEIYGDAFNSCTNLTSVTFEQPYKWKKYKYNSTTGNYNSIDGFTEFSNSTNNAKLLTDEYYSDYIYKDANS